LLYNIDGKLQESKSVSRDENIFGFSNVPTGSYLLVFLSRQQEALSQKVLAY